MLVELKVADFAIIENLHLQFNCGLNVLSGETGAGKSVLLKSLSLLMGVKASPEVIRTGADKAVIEGVFNLSQRHDVVRRLRELDIEVGEILIVRRIIGGDKSRVYLNGSINTLSVLRSIVAPLIDVDEHSEALIEVTGQHDNHNLKSKPYHLEILDGFLANSALRSDYTEKFKDYNLTRKQLSDLHASSKGKEIRLDYLKYQYEEIKKMNLSEGIDANLLKELKTLTKQAKLRDFTDSSLMILIDGDDSISSLLSRVIKSARASSGDPSDFDSIVKSLSDAKVIIEDASYEMQRLAGDTQKNNKRIEEIEDRLSSIRSLMRKHGGSVSEVIQAMNSMREEISNLESIESGIESLKAKELALLKDLKALGAQLTKNRQIGAVNLAKRVNSELADLNMKGTIFEIAMAEVDLCHTGCDEVEFQIKTSPRGEAKAIAKFASGGELSRILLAIKRSTGSSSTQKTLVFDEVDAGVSGETAEKIGRKLRQAARGSQVICVTHLPQVAAFADTHFFIRKVVDESGVSMDVSELGSRERVEEIARLISGEKISTSSLKHADQLIKEANDKG